MKQKSKDLRASNSSRKNHMLAPSEKSIKKFSILIYFARKHFSVRVQQVRLDDITLSRLASQLVESYALPAHRSGEYVLSTMDDDALDMVCYTSLYRLYFCSNTIRRRR